MNIVISDDAKARLLEISGTEAATPRFRLGLRSGGCKGFEQYIELNPLILDNDQVLEVSGITLVVDQKSSKLIDGMTLDWKNTLTEKRFVFTFPNKGTSCSCGSSFSL